MVDKIKDIKFSAHGAVLEYSSSVTFIVNIFYNEIIK